MLRCFSNAPRHPQALYWSKKAVPWLIEFFPFFQGIMISLRDIGQNKNALPKHLINMSELCIRVAKKNLVFKETEELRSLNGMISDLCIQFHVSESLKDCLVRYFNSQVCLVVSNFIYLHYYNFVTSCPKPLLKHTKHVKIELWVQTSKFLWPNTEL